MEVYIDDVVIKSPAKCKHLADLEKAFQRMRSHNLKMNPLKYAFGVLAGNVLGFLVHQRGIAVDKNKAKAIQAANPPKNKRELQRLLGQLNFLRRFISNCAGKTNVFSPLLKLKTEDQFEWNEQHQKAFDLLKQYLSSQPVLMPQRKDKD